MTFRIGAIILILVLLWGNLFRISFVVMYAVNPGDYTQTFCVNKADPESNCKGKCHLSRQTGENHDDQTPSIFPKFSQDEFLPSDKFIFGLNAGKPVLYVIQFFQLAEGFKKTDLIPPRFTEIPHST